MSSLNLIKSRFGRFQYLIIIFVWLLIFCLPILFRSDYSRINWTHITKVWTEYSFVLVVFLLHRFILFPKLYLRGERFVYFVSVIILLSLLVLVTFLYGQYFSSLRMPDPQNLPGGGPFRPPPLRPRPGHVAPFGNILILGVLVIGFDAGLIFSTKWLESEQKKLALEKENISSKMAFLQNQVSPHFFMNTLNNIHALIDISKEEAKDAVIRLSKLMDFMLYESQHKTISLKKEYEFIQSYVDLMRLRFTDDIDIKLELPEAIPEAEIPPLMTISFIENAFKHGITYEEQSFVHITYQIDDGNMMFKVKNSISKKETNTENSGIGLENTKKRLELLFGDTHMLDINNSEPDIFIVTLKIPL